MSSMTANLIFASKTACFLHKLCKKLENGGGKVVPINETSNSQKEIRLIVPHELKKSEPSDGGDLELDVHEVGAEKLKLKGIFVKSKESVPIEKCPETSNLNLKICNDKCLKLLPACFPQNDVFKESFNSTAPTMNKILSEINYDKYSSSKVGNSCENKAEKTINRISSTNTANLGYMSGKQHEAVFISKDLSSPSEMQSVDSYTLESNEGGREDLKFDVPEVCAEEISSENISAKSVDYVLVDFNILENNASPGGEDLKLDVQKVCAEEISLENISAESADYVLVDFNILENNESHDGEDLNLDLHKVCTETISLDNLSAKSEDSVLQNVSTETSSSSVSKISGDKFLNLNTGFGLEKGTFDEPFSATASTMDKILLEQNEIPSVGFNILGKIGSPSEEDLKLDVHEVWKEEISLENILAKSEESVPQDALAVECVIFESKVCDDKCLKLDNASAVKDDFDEIFNAEIINDKYSSLEANNICENKVKNCINRKSSMDTAYLETNASEIEAAEHEALLTNAASSSKNVIQSADFKIVGKNDSPGLEDLKLDAHEVCAEEISLQNTFAKSEEFIIQEVSEVTNSICDLKICDVKCLKSNFVFAINKNSFEEPFSATVSTINKLSETYNDKYSSSNTDNICKNNAEKSINRLSSMSKANLDSVKNAEVEHEALLINASSSQNVVQSVDSYILEKTESSGVKDIKLDVNEVCAEEIGLQNMLAKSEEFISQDVSVVASSSSEPKICDDKCLNLNSASTIKKAVFEELFNASVSTMNIILIEMNNNKYSSSKIDNICNNKAEKSINKLPSSLSNVNLNYAEKTEVEEREALSINTAATSQHLIQSADVCVSEKDDSPVRRDLKLDGHETCSEESNFQGALAKSEESVPQDLSAVTNNSSEPKICDDKYLNSASAVKKDVFEDPFYTIASVKDENLSETNNDKCLSSKMDNTCENHVAKSVTGTPSISGAISSSNSENKFQTFDFYELEKSDIEDPEWESVKKLESNEERYKQVRQCWGTEKVPNPNKNLTYHSYRKQKLKAGKLEDRLIKQLKRHASTKSAHRPAKKPRYCTYTVDNQIQSIKSKQSSQISSIQKEMKKKVNKLDNNFRYHLSQLNKFSNYYQSMKQFRRDRNLLESQYEQDVHDIRCKYFNKIDSYKAQCQSKINCLQKAHDEILTFCNFYEGLREDNPTFLTETQLQEIEEIDDVYEQFNKYYN